MSRFKIPSLRLLCTPWEKLPECPAILCLRERNLQKICQYLSLVDQVCLSLTCKQLFDLLGTQSKDRILAFPRLLRVRNPLLCVNAKFSTLNELLLRLENSRWAYCAKCLKLHPRKDFPKHSLREPSLKRSCHQSAGIADLCPCISLTIQSRDELIQILKSRGKPERTIHGFSESCYLDGKLRLIHRCGQRYGGWLGYTMWIVLELSLTDNGRLCVLARHTIRMRAPKDYLHVAEPCFACPHQDLTALLRNDTKDHCDHYDLLGSAPYKKLLSHVTFREVLKVCPKCSTLITKYTSSDMARFWVVRDLGSCRWRTSRSWFDQCRLTGVNLWRNKIYWWRSEGILLPGRSNDVLRSTNNVHGWWSIGYSQLKRR
ncbi:unnamed protein product [Penicillium salamii]|nr:unnamed protein product [Penicillium salamii]